MKIIGGNWKFNKELREKEKAKKFVRELEKKLEKERIGKGKVIIFPHFLVLNEVKKIAKRIKVGAQDLHWEESGSFTGAQPSAQDLKKWGIKNVLIAHSETRKYFGVTEERVRLKLKSALKEKLFPLICIGEDIEEKERGETKEVLRKQIEEGILPSLNKNSRFLIAYEPLYAISGFAKLRGKEPRPAKIEDVKLSHNFIKETFKKRGFKVKVLYGGSCSPQNAKELLSQDFIDGLLVGSKSWDLESFLEIVRIAKKI